MGWGVLKKEINVTFMGFIPNKAKLIVLKDFRPISIVGYVYKLLSKVLTKHLKHILPLIISPFQWTFGDRQILDAVLIANELIDSMKHSCKDVMMLKIDFKKEYDHVDWVFVDYVLCRFDFCEK